MILHEETPGDDGAAGQVQGADLEVIDVLAAAALEVIVMPHAGPLVARLAIGKDDGLDALRVEEEIEGTVNGGDAEAAECRLRTLEDLLDGDGTLGLGYDQEDRVALAGMSLAERGWHVDKLMAGAAFAQGKRKAGASGCWPRARIAATAWNSRDCPPTRLPPRKQSRPQHQMERVCRLQFEHFWAPRR